MSCIGSQKQNGHHRFGMMAAARWLRLHHPVATMTRMRFSNSRIETPPIRAAARLRTPADRVATGNRFKRRLDIGCGDGGRREFKQATGARQYKSNLFILWNYKQQQYFAMEQYSPNVFVGGVFAGPPSGQADAPSLTTFGGSP
jgi:hypothetical protein